MEAGLLVVARLRIQPALRVGGALLTAAAAVGWLLDRFGVPNPVARTADSAGSHTTLMPAALALTAVAAIGWALSIRRRAQAGPGGDLHPGPLSRPLSRSGAVGAETLDR